MATSAIYRLFPMAVLTDVEESGPFPTGGRTAWRFTLHLARLAVGGSAQFVVESSPGYNEDDDWAERHDFTLLDETDLPNSPFVADVSVPAADRFLRARLAAQTGDVIAEVLAASPFLDPGDPDDVLLLPKLLRDYEDGLVRIVEAAEDDVLQHLDRSPYGRLDAELDRPDALDRMQEAIALQAMHRYQREQLEQAKNAASQERLAAMPKIAKSVALQLEGLRPTDHLVWMGR